MVVWEGSRHNVTEDCSTVSLTASPSLEAVRLFGVPRCNAHPVVLPCVPKLDPVTSFLPTANYNGRDLVRSRTGGCKCGETLFKFGIVDQIRVLQEFQGGDPAIPSITMFLPSSVITNGGSPGFREF